MILIRLLLIPIRVIGQFLKKAYKEASLIVKKLTLKSFVTFLISAFITAWGFYTYYYPDVTIEFTEPLQPNNILTSIFSISNNGNSDINYVNSYYEIKNIHLETKSGNYIRNTSFPEPFEIRPFYKIAKKRKQAINVVVYNLSLIHI